MGKFIIGTFFILGWTFYELSGGADFVPEERPVQLAEADIEVDMDTAVQVTRASGTSWANLAMPVTNAAAEPAVIQASATAPADSVSVDNAVAQIVSDETFDASADITAIDANKTANLTGTVAAPAAPEPVASPELDIRLVAGSVVNMRAGPGTNFDVVGQMPQGTEAEVLRTDESGWAFIRILATNQEGWMAERLLSDS